MLRSISVIAKDKNDFKDIFHINNFVTLFGKTKLNANSVVPFFHFNAFSNVENALENIFNAFQNIGNVPPQSQKYVENHFKSISKHLKCVFKHDNDNALRTSIENCSHKHYHQFEKVVLTTHCKSP